MADTTTECRMTPADMNISVSEMITRLTGGNLGSTRVLVEWLDRDPMAVLAFLTVLDLKHLYDEHIWVVYDKICDQDIDRFIYHVSMELPNQATGRLSVSGPYSRLANDAFWAKRQSGKPGAYWALEQPPTERNYSYPIV